MTDAKFCDIHTNPNNVVPKDRTMRITISQYDAKNKAYLQLFLDGCKPCINEKLILVAKSFGLDVENGWKVDQLIPPKTRLNKNQKKWKHVWMSLEELIEYRKEREEELAQIDEEQPEPLRVVPKVK